MSVGKFADGVEGISGDARRATYRKFARIVGEIVFVVFVTNFWYGLIAGYLQGTSLVPQIFGPWSVGPGWGKLIVSEHINLARYQEIPLWVLLFLHGLPWSLLECLLIAKKIYWLEAQFILID